MSIQGAMSYYFFGCFRLRDDHRRRPNPCLSVADDPSSPSFSRDREDQDTTEERDDAATVKYRDNSVDRAAELDSDESGLKEAIESEEKFVALTKEINHLAKERDSALQELAKARERALILEEEASLRESAALKEKQELLAYVGTLQAELKRYQMNEDPFWQGKRESFCSGRIGDSRPLTKHVDSVDQNVDKPCLSASEVDRGSSNNASNIPPALSSQWNDIQELTNSDGRQVVAPEEERRRDDMQTPGSVFAMGNNNNARLRSQHVYTVANPTENLSYLKIFEDMGERYSSSHRSSPSSRSCMDEKENSVELSFSPWLRPPCYDEHGNLLKKEEDKPVMGLVAAQQRFSHVSSKWWPGNGIPNSTSKYKEDQKVNWHATPFEERLNKALNEESFIFKGNLSK